MRALHVGLGAALLGCASAAATAACSSDDPSVPSGSGNDIIVDVPVTTQPTAAEDAGPDSPFARVDGGAYNKPDGYDPYGVCKACACPATDYCFGGGSGNTTFTTCTPTGFGVGCQPIPAACAADASCDCLLTATAANTPGCYPVCVQNTRILYCPNP